MGTEGQSVARISRRLQGDINRCGPAGARTAANRLRHGRRPKARPIAAQQCDGPAQEIAGTGT